MKEWRRRYILAVSAHPFRAIAGMMALCAFAGAVMCFLIVGLGDGSVNVAANPDQPLRQAVLDLFGPVGYLYVTSMAMWSALGAVFGVLWWVVARASEHQIRAQGKAGVTGSI